MELKDEKLEKFKRLVYGSNWTIMELKEAKDKLNAYRQSVLIEP